MAPPEDDSPLTAFEGLLSPETLDFLHSAALHPHSPVQIFKRHTAIKLQQALNIAYVFLAPLIDRALALLTASPGVVSLIAFISLLAAAWIVLGWIRRIMMFATRMVFRMVFWAAVVAVGSAVWRNGVFETFRDAVVVGGKIWGFLAVAKDVWVGELRRYEEEARVQGRR
ncbi:hypothetical protein ACHAQH_000290 [Verticillium albo-atrum]